MAALIDLSGHTARPLKGVALVALATLVFALADLITKQQAMRHPVSVVIAVRYMVNLAILIVIFGPRLGRGLWAVNRPGLVFIRSLWLTLASLTMALALREMPLGETVAIIYLYPIAVMLLAVPLLGEKVGPLGWIGAACGFLGVLLIVRPGSGLAPLGVIFALVNAACATGYNLLTRFLSHSENTVAMLFQTALLGCIFFCIMALGSLDGLVIGWPDLAMMGLLGGLAALGHYLFTAAYREATASHLAPITYLHLFWATGLGFLVFGHLPDVLAFGGMALIFMGGVLVTLWSGRAPKP